MQGKVAFVTGAAQGIGRATAMKFSRAGAAVAVADIQDEKGNAVAAEIERSGGRSLYIPCDVTDEESVKSAVERTCAAFGRLDFAYNNAGIPGPARSALNYSLEDWNHVIAINLTGVWLCMKYEIAAMLKTGGGAIVNAASVTGLVGSVKLVAYSASKHGVIGLTKTVALELAKKNIRVNAVCPGLIETEMLLEMPGYAVPETRAQLLAAEPVGRFGRPEEIAATVVFLCSAESGFATGIAMPVDGGWVAQ